MFTGIIEATGTVRNLQQVGEEYWLTVKTLKLELADVKLGDSIAVNGCCLTVVDLGVTGNAASYNIRFFREGFTRES